MEEQLKQLFYSIVGHDATSITPLSASGSNRQYFRLSDSEGHSFVGCHGTSQQENEAFLAIDRHFVQQGLDVPQVVAQSADKMSYLQQDLGDTLLFDYIAGSRKTGVFGAREQQMLALTMRQLAHIQVRGAQGLDFQVCYPQAEFNRRSILWDLNYFKYCFLKATGLDFQEDLLENDFEQLADCLLQVPRNTFMYRDFQSRNVMIHNQKPYFIDFQGGRRGPLHYDVASFLWQARANYGEQLRSWLIDQYLDELQKLQEVNAEQFRQELQLFIMFRTLQVLGAYGFRGYFEKKPHFLQSIPYALNNLRDLLRQSHDYCPYLMQVLRQMTELKQFQEQARKPLMLTVYSFSYKKGIPSDSSGNGGGFVFDMRAVNNPGKYERYMGLTGQDQPVIDFLEQDGEITAFLNHAYELVDANVRRYIERGFQNLMACFGCTGGRHRSVYAAQHMAEHIHQKFGIEVRLIHREQNQSITFPAK